MHAALPAINATTLDAINVQFCATTVKSSDMPTAKKNSPSSSPRNGSTSASSWWRKCDSDSITPAKNAPIAIDSPPFSINTPAPSTTSNAAAVITSRALLRANTLNSGFNSQRPAATIIATLPNALPMSSHSGVLLSMRTGDKNATIASSGTISKSSNSKIDTIFCPDDVPSSLRSPSTDITIAVDVSTKPAAPTNDTCHEKPNAMPTAVSNAAAITTCKLPSPKICRRKCHKCDGFISKPITNRKITTPSSATCKIVCPSENSPSPNLPIASPAAK